MKGKHRHCKKKCVNFNLKFLSSALKFTLQLTKIGLNFLPFNWSNKNIEPISGT